MTSHPTPSSCNPAELLACPFCGGTPSTIERPDNIDGTEFFYAVACYCGGYSACAHKMAKRKTPEQAKADAIAAWNRRAASAVSPSQAQSDIAAIRHTLMTGLAHNAAIAALNRIAGIQSPAAPVGGEVKAPGWVMVPRIGTRVRADHPQTCLNPEPTFEVVEVKADTTGSGFAVRGENTCWFGVGMVHPASSVLEAQPQPSDQGEKRDALTVPTDKLAELQREAARYRWLRDKARSVDWSRYVTARIYTHYCRTSPEQMDADIEAALGLSSAAQPQGEK